MHDENKSGSNPSNNPWLTDVIARGVNRRALLGGALGTTAVQFLAGSLLTGKAGARPAAGSLLGFSEVPPSDGDDIVVPPGYAWEVFLPWGTPLFPSAPAFQEDASNSAADQEQQVGFNHDGMHYFSLGSGPVGNERGLLVMNHEYTDATQIYTAAQGSVITPDSAGKEKVAKALAGHGVTVARIHQTGSGKWKLTKGSPFNRRITGTTPMDFSGPVGASHPMLQSKITPNPIGTLNNCANGYAPWGTYLACEENWNGYFGTESTTWAPNALEARYGISKTGFGYDWHIAEERFDVEKNGNELNRFGWVVEIDPLEPASTPVKRTALGRIKHEGATVTESDGRVVVYTGDDENGDYLYKFVGNGSWRLYVQAGQSPLDHGDLYVAKFNEDGTGEWLPLIHGQGPLTVANGWADQADVLIRTRLAADALGATRLHRPEWITENPLTKEMFVTLTNGTGNNHPVNSNRDPNPYGHIVRFSEAGGDHTLLTFAWEIFILAGDPAHDPTVPANQTIFGSPDGIWADPDERIWIETDISNSSQNRADRGYDNIKNNQLLTADPNTGEIRRFLTGPRGCEITGIIATPDQRTLFINVQHPGESTTFWNNLFGAPSTDDPSTVSSWPYGRRPRPSTVVIRKLDGGVIGT